MKKITYTIEMLSDWHCGSGLGAGADADAVLIRDKNGCPYIPGKTLKGLLREAAHLFVQEDKINCLFGIGTDSDKGSYGKDGVYFTDARLSQESSDSQDENIRNISQICIDQKSGTTQKGSLRVIEVAGACTLKGEILDIPDEQDAECLIKALKLTKRLGLNRNRGLGRCRLLEWKLTGEESSNVSDGSSSDRLQFKCTLLSDVILNQNSATEQAHRTLDFIPGNIFLGLAAKCLYGQKAANGAEISLFHSSCVCWGDAHPAGIVDGRYHRTSHVPLSLYREKNNDDKLYLHHYLSPDSLDAGTQLKQCRTGFYDLCTEQKQYPQIEHIRTFTLKSTYGAWNQKPEDKQVFGYECLKQGAEFLFEVTLSENVKSLRNAIQNVLTGRHRIGASHSAQYGLVEIAPCSYDETQNGDNSLEDGNIYIYADSRLIFLEGGEPTCTPTNICGHEIVWEKSQIRTFQHTPWNGKRATFDTARYGIEKGSVLVVEGKGDPIPSFVGSYQNEGYGHIILNPHFLFTEKVSGEADYSLSRSPSSNVHEATLPKTIYTLVAEELQTQHYVTISASQWGAIRNKALSCRHLQETALSDEIKSFISKGVCAWSYSSRTALGEFMEKVKKAGCNLSNALVLLARYMGKDPKESAKSNNNNYTYE